MTSELLGSPAVPLLLGGLILSLCFYLAGEIGREMTARDRIGLGYGVVTGYLLISSVVIEHTGAYRSPLRLIGVGMFVAMLVLHARQRWNQRR